MLNGHGDPVTAGLSSLRLLPCLRLCTTGTDLDGETGNGGFFNSLILKF